MVFLQRAIPGTLQLDLKSPREPSASSRGPFSPNWRLLGIALCDKSFIGLQANPYKPWAPGAVARYP